MASMRDALNRLQVIYDACNPEAVAAKQAEAGLDEFQRLRKRLHRDIRAIRTALREREDLLTTQGTTPETAEQSYRIRIQIRAVRDAADRMKEIVAKEEKRAAKRGKDDGSKENKDPDDPAAQKAAKLAERKEILDLTLRHIEEVENLERRRFNEGVAIDREELMAGGNTGVAGRAGGHRAIGTYGGHYDDVSPSSPSGADPFESGLPDIDVEEDFKAINERNRAIDEDLEVIGAGVARLKELANNMGQELDRQNEDLAEVDRKVNKALDHVDNVNIQMRKVVDGVMKGDKFMMNCILLCVLLALLGFIASLFQTT
ncbi:hypothetical protein DFJ73DRAFT_858936 [Zopfochytrium polystomum]|nr:hypothetical protein DFJ73DRAFT_858936 [Zopfochytrium polystomum]